MNEETLDLSDYARESVSNVNGGRQFFDYGLQLFLSYQHELAAKYFQDCVEVAPDCALAHALIAQCHAPNYNFKGEMYYDYSYNPEDEEKMIMDDMNMNDEEEVEGMEIGDQGGQNDVRYDEPPFPSQVVANRHSLLAIETVERLKGKKKAGGGGFPFVKKVFDKKHQHERQHQQGDSNESEAIQDVEVRLIQATRILTCEPGMDPAIAEANKDKPFAEAMHKIYNKYGSRDAEVAYMYVSSLMTIHAWTLFEYPTGRPLSDEVLVIQSILEKELKRYPEHVGLCHLYCHLCEMSAYPEKALSACDVLRTKFPDAGHLVHMPTHIDVLIGDYEACVRCNAAAIKADKRVIALSPKYNHKTTFYFSYIVHDYHMLVYGAILGGMEQIAMKYAKDLNSYLFEDFFTENPDVLAFLDSYSAMDVHILVRFGRWQEILKLKLPKDSDIMLYRSAAIYFARAVAYANLGDIRCAKQEASCHEKLRVHPNAKKRLLHNNIVSDLLNVDAAMAEGEIAYFAGNHDTAFKELRRAVELQDGLNYDEPWGKMQPVRHALGGLLLKDGLAEEAEVVFKDDLKRHPKNPWALTGLIGCLDKVLGTAGCNCTGSGRATSGEKETIEEEDRLVKEGERNRLQIVLDKQRSSKWADFDITHSCACSKSE